MRTLISCVGSSKYQQCTYAMADGTQISSSIFSAALIHNTKEQKSPVERVILIGTTDSGWNTTLVELLSDRLLRDQYALDQEERLTQAIRMNAVSQSALDESAGILSRELGLDFQLVLVPRAVDQTEQEDFVGKVLNALQGTTFLHVDVTHGYRHWPILLSQVAFLFKQTHSMSIERISYGFLDNNNAGNGKEVILDTYLGVGERTAAAAFFKQTWDSRVLKKLLPEDKRLSLFTSQLEKFTFMLSMNNIDQARAAAHQILAFFRSDDSTCRGVLFPFYDLIKSTLERLASGGNSSWQHDREFFKGLIEHGDFYRAVMFLWESCLTKILRHSLESLYPNNPRLLNEALHNLRVRQCMTVWSVHKREFHRNGEFRRHVRTLNQLRNFVAHGGVIREDMGENLKRAMNSSAALTGELNLLEKELMNGEPAFELKLAETELRQVLADEGLLL